MTKYKPGDRVLIVTGASGGYCAGTVIERLDGPGDSGGDWLIASDGHGHAVARDEGEMEMMEGPSE